MNESFYYDASSTPATSMFLRPNENGNGNDVRSSRYEDGAASTSASANASGSRAGEQLPLPADSSQEWVEETGSASSGDTSERVQQSTVRYRVKSPRKDVRMSNTGSSSSARSGSARAGGAGSTQRSSRSTQSTPRASASSTPNAALKRRNRQPRETAEDEEETPTSTRSSLPWGGETPRQRRMEASYRSDGWQFSWLCELPSSSSVQLLQADLPLPLICDPRLATRRDITWQIRQCDLSA